MLDGETRMFSKESLEWLPLMGGGIIQQHNDRAAQVPQQLTQKHADLLLSDVVKEEQIVEAESVSFRAQRNSGDDGDFVAASLAMTLQGRRASGRPGSDHQGGQEEAGFIGKN